MSEAQQDPRDAARRREAETILRRVQQETDPQIGGAGRLLTNVRAHLSAVDADPGDRMEVLGTRIGRILGLAAFLVMAAWLVTTFLSS